MADLPEPEGSVFYLINHTGHIARCDDAESLAFVFSTAQHTKTFLLTADTEGFYKFPVEPGENLSISIRDADQQTTYARASKTYEPAAPETTSTQLVWSSHPLVRICNKSDLIIRNF